MAHYGAIVEGQDIQFILGDHSQGGGKWLQCSLDSEVEVSTNFRKVLQCPEKVPTKAFSLLKALTHAFTIKNLKTLCQTGIKTWYVAGDFI